MLPRSGEKWKKFQSDWGYQNVLLCTIYCMLHITLPIHYFITVSQLDIRADKFTSTPLDRGECVSRSVDPQHGDRTEVFRIAGRFFTVWATREIEAQNCCMIHSRSHVRPSPVGLLWFPWLSTQSITHRFHTMGFVGPPVQNGAS